MSEFLVVTSTFSRQPWLAVPLIGGLLLAFGALIMRMQGVAFGDPVGSNAPSRASLVPLFAHFFLVLAAGIFIPPLFVAWFKSVAALLG
jgi:hydrogenase-4 component F